MKKIPPFSGIVLVFLSTALLAVGFFAHWTTHNVFSALCLLLIIAGIVLHVVLTKRNGKY